MSPRSYHVLGDVWVVPLALDAQEAPAVSEPVVTVELSIEVGAGSLAAPPESAWLAGEVFDGIGYVLFRGESGVATWYPRLGVAHFSSDLSGIRIRAEPDTEATWALLLAASIPAQRALLLGDLCLHAGAFDHQGKAVLVIGPSGSGKSTLIACAAQHGFIPLSDDAVRVGWRTGRAECAAGSSSLRLRVGTPVCFSAGTQWTPTVDGRVARPIEVAERRFLSALVVLRPDATCHEVLELRPATAVTRLIAVGDRVLAIRDPELVRARFAQWAELVRWCRVFELTFPRAGTLENVEATFGTLERALESRPAREPDADAVRGSIQ